MSFSDASFDKEVYANAGGAQDLYVTFSPDSGYKVDVASFTLQTYPGAPTGAGGTGTWTLYDGSTSGTVISQGSWDQSSKTITAVNTYTVNALSVVVGAVSDAAVLDIHLNGDGNNGYLGIDNISFSQVATPEPGTLALLVTGLIGLLAYARASGSDLNVMLPSPASWEGIEGEGGWRNGWGGASAATPTRMSRTLRSPWRFPIARE